MYSENKVEVNVDKFCYDFITLATSDTDIEYVQY